MAKRVGCPVGMHKVKYLDRCVKTKLSPDSKLVENIMIFSAKEEKMSPHINIKAATSIMDSGFRSGDVDTAADIIGHRFCLRNRAVVSWYKEKYGVR